jgi:hypothetical protein
MVRSALPPRREVIVISSDIDEDSSSDEEEGIDSHAAVTKPTAAAPSTLAAAVVADSSSSSSSSSSSYKYDLEPPYRRIVETIFPQFEEHHKATLERAFATSRVLRENYIVTRYLGSGASGFVLAAKRAFDGREVCILIEIALNKNNKKERDKWSGHAMPCLCCMWCHLKGSLSLSLCCLPYSCFVYINDLVQLLTLSDTLFIYA